MSMIECKKEISDTAKACPHCGAKVPKTKWWLWGPLGLLALFFLMPYLFSSKAERAAISVRSACEQMFPMERGRGCDAAYSKTLQEELKKQ